MNVRQTEVSPDIYGEELTRCINLLRSTLALLLFLFVVPTVNANPRPGKTVSFNESWQFYLGDVADGQRVDLDDSRWRTLNVPHDWSIEGRFDEKNPAGTGGGQLVGVRQHGFGKRDSLFRSDGNRRQ